MTSIIVTGAAGTRSDAVASAVAALAGQATLVEGAALAAASALVLEHLGWSVQAPPASPDAELRPDAAVLDDAGRLLREGPPPSATPAPADGAAAGLLVPWWRRLLGDDLVVVVALDDPARAAWRASLEQGTEPEAALAAWLAWHRHLATGASGLPVIVVDPTAVLAPGGAATSSLAEALASLGLRVAEAEAPADAPAPGSIPAPGGEPPAGIPSPGLTATARSLADAWRPSAVTVWTSGLDVPAAEAWEVALLAAGRRILALQTLHARDVAAIAEAEAHAAAAATLQRDLATAEERLADLDTRLAVALEDAAAAAEHTAAVAEELATQRARADELAGLEAARRAELLAAGGREQTLALVHLQQAASPLGRLAGRWTRLAERVPAVRAVDRAADRALLAAMLRPRILRPHPLFDAAWYAQQYADVGAAGIDPYRHYRKHGSREGRRPNPWLDPDWYRARYPDVAAAGVDPMDHYHERGWREGRDPGADFDTGWYLRANPDVLISGVDPLEHYLHHGAAEGRSPRGADSARWTLGPGWIAEAAPAAGPALSPGDEPLPRAASAWAEEIAGALAALPMGARAIVVADRGDAPPQVPGRTALWLAPLPGTQAGGRMPATDREAVVRLEAARWTGADHVLLHRDQAWWLERSPELATLLGRYRRVSLARLPVSGWRLAPISRPPEDGADALLGRIRRTVGREPSILAWGVPAASLARLAGTVFEPPVETTTLPYLDGTVDVVVIPDADDQAIAPQRLAEARRVAGSAVLRSTGRQGVLEPAVLAPSIATPARVAVAFIGGPGREADAAALTRLADSLLDEPVDALLVTVPLDPAVRPPLPAGPGLPPARPVPVPTEATVADRLLAVAAATDADLLAIVDGTADPVPGWLPVMTAALEADPGLDAVVPVIATPVGHLAGSDGRDVGDARARIVKRVPEAPASVVLVRRDDLLTLRGGAGGRPSPLSIEDEGARLVFARGGRLEPAALAILAARSEESS